MRQRRNVLSGPGRYLPFRAESSVRQRRVLVLVRRITARRCPSETNSDTHRVTALNTTQENSMVGADGQDWTGHSTHPICHCTLQNITFLI
jgi:hypothetical protein